MPKNILIDWYLLEQQQLQIELNDCWLIKIQEILHNLERIPESSEILITVTINYADLESQNHLYGNFFPRHEHGKTIKAKVQILFF